MNFHIKWKFHMISCNFAYKFFKKAAKNQRNLDFDAFSNCNSAENICNSTENPHKNS